MKRKNIKDIDMNKSLNIELSDGTIETKIVQIKEKWGISHG